MLLLFVNRFVEGNCIMQHLHQWEQNYVLIVIKLLARCVSVLRFARCCLQFLFVCWRYSALVALAWRNKLIYCRYCRVWFKPLCQFVLFSHDWNIVDVAFVPNAALLELAASVAWPYDLCFRGVPLHVNWRNIISGWLCTNLVDPASSHMLVSKIKPCMSQCKSQYGKTVNGSLKQL